MNKNLFNLAWNKVSTSKCEHSATSGTFKINQKFPEFVRDSNQLLANKSILDSLSIVKKLKYRASKGFC